MEEIISKEIAKKFMEMKGEVRGVALKSHEDFIIKEEGEEGLKKLEEMMAELGCPIKYKEIKIMDFYPIGLEAVALLAIQKIFNFDEEKFEEIGIFQSKISLIIKLFMKYFGSIKMVIQRAPEIWRKYYTVGNLRIVEFDEDKGYAILRIEDFNIHWLHCRHIKGYCYNVVKMIVKKPVTCQETKCLSFGDKYHEFLLKW